MRKAFFMNFERVIDSSHPMFDTAIELYKVSFPAHEQREEFSQKEILHDEAYHFDLIYDEDEFVGIVLYWEHSDFIYLEHFCILPKMRNRRYGHRVLTLFEEKGKNLILEIDPPIDEISIRRLRFYQRCGFIENPYTHIHPPYHKEYDGHVLAVMTNPRILFQSEYDEFNTYLKDHIMNDVFK